MGMILHINTGQIETSNIFERTANLFIEILLDYSFIKIHVKCDDTFYQPLRSGRIWHKVNF